jgi:hypothetical protein
MRTNHLADNFVHSPSQVVVSFFMANRSAFKGLCRRVFLFKKFHRVLHYLHAIPLVSHPHVLFCFRRVHYLHAIPLVSHPHAFVLLPEDALIARYPFSIPPSRTVFAFCTFGTLKITAPLARYPLIIKSISPTLTVFCNPILPPFSESPSVSLSFRSSRPPLPNPILPPIKCI